MPEVPADVSGWVPMIPTVCAVMLANGRPKMVERAKACWFAQDYAGEKRILIYNNNGDRSIGTMRNAANAQTDAEIIIHWDSDDWSHPNRIAEQVALLQSSGAECVGYNEMLFWVESQKESMVVPQWNAPHTDIPTYSAWIYRAAIPNYSAGTAMCYWRKTWEKYPFADRSEGCDDLYWFNIGVKIESTSAMIPYVEPNFAMPRMIASIHENSTCASIKVGAREWTRVPEWAAYCREAMKL